ncbi:MAG TPA: hypothetical protein DEF51_39565, partial [Myxococcales bacterium]|nr:hypothetical protein [Myxococcales bacterium]
MNDQTESAPLPGSILREIARVRGRLNRHVLLDALLSGLGAALAVGAPVALALSIAGVDLVWAAAAAGLALALVAGWEIRQRWADALDAAMVLDGVLDAKDRFATALQLSGAADVPKLHRLQIRSAETFLADAGAIPKAPRPAFHVGRYAAAAVIALGLAVPIAYVWPELAAWVAGDEGPIQQEDPRTPEEIAAAAEALRQRLAENPDRRLDAEINALEHELAEQRARAMDQRTDAIREAAEILERAAGIDPDAEDREGGEAGDEQASAEERPLPTSVDQEPPETASRRLMDQWNEAREAMERWREAARRPEADPFQTAQLQHEAQRAQMEALQLARQERSWEQAQTEEQREAQRRQREQREAESETPADRLSESVDRLDRALARLHRDDDSPDVPPPAVSEALRDANERLAEHTPRTAEQIERAAGARDRGEGEQMDRALEQARE